MAAYATWAIRCQEPIVDIVLVRRPQQVLVLALTALVSIVTFAVMVLVPEFMQVIQGRSSVVAGLALLPQGLITGIGTVLGNHGLARWGVRRTVVLGMIILTVSTFGVLAVTETSPAWLVAFVLSGRGFAIGLVMQPLLNGFIKPLPADKVPDGNTLFNVVERVSGTLGIALIVTFFQVREHVHILQAVRHLGLPGIFQGQGAGLALPTLPAPMHHELAHAMASGFHDVICLVAGISALGVIMALMIKDRSTSNGKAP
ncbi:MFS transporter [Alicyclobacillus cellulosilyticus]|uniref:MFS transporter n=1 Tax=Alicyclobacillus cellulosilyticus TaxID=1003997 RepID=UPI00166882B8|nr:MFS transporter [Alicyclobacillus cellulosilyticus]